MSKIRIVVGLPGSGKTTYALQNLLGVLYDDPAQNQEIFNHMKASIVAEQDLTITDVYLGSPELRQIVENTLQSCSENLEIEWIFFENDPQACIANLHRRKDDRIISPTYIEEISKAYQIPEGANVLPVYRPSEK